MRKYPKYKPSYIEWIGDIPEHWEVEKLRYIGNFTSSGIDKKINEDEPLVKIINYTDIYGNPNKVLTSDRNYMEVSCPEEKRAEHQVKRGDLVFTPSSETIEDIGLSALVDEDLENTAYSYHVLRFRFNKQVDHSFKKYLCNNHFVLNKFSANAKGTTRQILNRENFNSALVILPPKSEQTAIANLLDEKTTKIDKLITNKQKLIELLKKERTAIINQAVTRGINPNVKLKPSGNIFVGNIPNHWAIVKCNHYIRLRHGYQFMNYDFTPFGIKVVKITQLKSDGTLDLSEATFIDESRLQEFQDILINEGDVLMALTGGTIGKIIQVTEVKEPILQNYRVGNFFPANNKITKDFMFWVLSSEIILNQIFFEQRETGQPNIGKENFNSMKIVLPPIIEQTPIVQHLAAETQRVDSTISKIEQEIELLQEYRTALISEVVTGKIKVI